MRYYQHVRDFDFRIPETIFDKDPLSLIFLVCNLVDFCLFYVLREIHPDSPSLMYFMWIPLQLLITFDAIYFTIQCTNYHIRFLTWYYIMWMLSRVSAIATVIVVPFILKKGAGKMYYYHMGSFSMYRGLLPSLGPIVRMKKSHTRWVKEYYIPDFIKSVTRIAYSVVAFVFCYAGLFQIFNFPIGTDAMNTIDSVYHTLVTISSIGYGDIAPTNPIARVILCFYIIAFLGNLPIFVRNSTEELHATRLLHKLRSACKNGITIVSDQSISFAFLLRLILPANIHIGLVDVTEDENPHLRHTCYSFNNVGYINLNTCGENAERRALDFEFLVNSLVGKSRKIVVSSPASSSAMADSTCLAMALNCSRVARVDTQLIIMTREGGRSQTLQSHIGAYHENCYIIDITDFSAKILVLAILFPGFATFFFNLVLPSHVSLHRLENRTADFYNEKMRNVRIRTSLLLANARVKGKARSKGQSKKRSGSKSDDVIISNTLPGMQGLDFNTNVSTTLDTNQHMYSPHVRFADLKKRYTMDISSSSILSTCKDAFSLEDNASSNVQDNKARVTKSYSIATLSEKSPSLAPSSSLPEIPYDSTAIAIAVSASNLGTASPVPITLETMQTACSDYFGKDTRKRTSSFSNTSTVPSVDSISALESRNLKGSFQVLRSKEPRLPFDKAVNQFISKVTKFPTIEFLRSTIEIPVFDFHPGLIHDNKWRAWVSFEQNKNIHLFLPAMVAATEPLDSDSHLTFKSSSNPLKPKYLRKSSVDLETMARSCAVDTTSERFRPLAVIINKRDLQRKEDDCLNYKDTFVKKWRFNTKLFKFDICCNLDEKLALDKPDLKSITKRFPIYAVKHCEDRIWHHTSKTMSASRAIYSLKRLSKYVPLIEQPGESLGDISNVVSLSNINEMSMPGAQINMLPQPVLSDQVPQSTLSRTNSFGIESLKKVPSTDKSSEPLAAMPDNHVESIGNIENLNSLLKKNLQGLMREYTGVLNPQFNDYVITSTVMNHTLSLGPLQHVKISAKDVNSFGLIILHDLDSKLFYAIMSMLMDLQTINSMILIFDCVSDDMMTKYRSMLYKMASRLVDHVRSAVPKKHDLCKAPHLERAYSSKDASFTYLSKASLAHLDPITEDQHTSSGQLKFNMCFGDEQASSIHEHDIDSAHMEYSHSLPQELYVVSQEDTILTYALPKEDKDGYFSESESQTFTIKIYSIDSTIPDELTDIGFNNLDRAMIVNPLDDSTTTEGHLLLTKSACEMIGHTDVIVYSMDVYNTLMLHDLGFGDNYRSGSFIPSIEAILTGTFIHYSENALTALMLMNKVFAYKDSIIVYQILFDDRTRTHTIFANTRGSHAPDKIKSKRFSQRVLTVEALQSFLGECGLEVLYYSICGCILIAPDPSLFVENKDFIVAYSTDLFKHASIALN